MQDSKKIIEESLAGIRPQRTSVFDLLANDAVIGHFAGSPLDGTDDEKVVIDAAGNALDGTRSIASPNQEKKTWTDEAGNIWVSDRWTSWLKTPAFPDVDSWAEWMKKYIDENETGSGMTVKLALTESAPGDERRRIEAAEQRVYNTALNGTVNIFCTPSTAINAVLYYIGLEIFCYLWADYHDLLLRWIEVYQELTLNYIEIAGNVETSPLAMIYSDIAYKNGPMLGRKMFDEMGFFDEVERICGVCHEKGLRVIFHSDGNIMELLDDLAAAGIDGLNPIEKAAGMDIFEIRRRFPELTLVGGVDVTHLLRTASPEEIRSRTRDIIAETGADGRLLIGSSTEVGNDVPLENYLAFHEEVIKV